MKRIKSTVTRYIEELTWVCSNCGALNLLPKLKCFRCSKPRDM